MEKNWSYSGLSDESSTYVDDRAISQNLDKNINKSVDYFLSIEPDILVH